MIYKSRYLNGRAQDSKWYNYKLSLIRSWVQIPIGASSSIFNFTFLGWNWNWFNDHFLQKQMFEFQPRLSLKVTSQKKTKFTADEQKQKGFWKTDWPHILLPPCERCRAWFRCLSKEPRPRYRRTRGTRIPLQIWKWKKKMFFVIFISTSSFTMFILRSNLVMQFKINNALNSFFICKTFLIAYFVLFWCRS